MIRPNYASIDNHDINIATGLNRLQSRIHKQYMNDLFVELCLTVPVRLRSEIRTCCCVVVSSNVLNVEVRMYHISVCICMCVRACVYVNLAGCTFSTRYFIVCLYQYYDYYSSLLPYLHMLMDPLVSALNGSQTLISQVRTSYDTLGMPRYKYFYVLCHREV